MKRVPRNKSAGKIVLVSGVIIAGVFFGGFFIALMFGVTFGFTDSRVIVTLPVQTPAAASEPPAASLVDAPAATTDRSSQLGLASVFDIRSVVPENLLASTAGTNGRWYERIQKQITHVWGTATDAWRRVLAGEFWLLAQVSDAVPVTDSSLAVPPGPSTGLRFLQPATDPAAGTLRINTPLLLDNALSVSGTTTLATTTVAGPFAATDGTFDAATVLNALTAGAVSAGSIDTTQLTATGITTGTLGATTAEISSLQVLATAAAVDLLVENSASVGSLSVLGGSEFAAATFGGLVTIDELLTATGGVETGGADIDAGEGRVFASNIVNQIIAGDNIVITGTQAEPVVSVSMEDLVGVLSLNNQTGELSLVGGTDIQISGLNIQNTSTLSSVRLRGGCTDCITDADVRADLTISGGVINNTPIGLTTPSSAQFTTVSIGTTTSSTTLSVGGALEVSERIFVTGSATSTFSGSINLESGCFAIGGVCLEGVEPSSYVGLTDTPSSLFINALQFANASGTALTQSEDLVFADGRLGIGTSTPSTTLSVVGDTTLDGTLRVTSATSSQFSGGLNVTDGCVSVDGVCLISGVDSLADLLDVDVATATTGDLFRFTGANWENVLVSSLGLGDGTFLGLLDTPAAYLTGAIPFTNLAGDGLDQSGDFVFTNNNLGIGTSTPSSRLTVVGDSFFSGAFRVENATSSQFVGGLNVTDGCVSVDGACIGGASDIQGLADVSIVSPEAGEVFSYDGSTWRNVATSTLGLGDGTFRGLSDTPNTYTARAVSFVNSGGTALTQSSQFVFDGSQLGVGTSDLRSTLTVGGTTSLLGAAALRFYDADSSNYVGFRSPSALADNVVWTLPAGDGTANQLLVTDGDGNLRFDDIASVGGGATTFLQLLDTPTSYTLGGIPFVNASSTALTQSGNFVFRDGRLGIGVSNPVDELVVQGSVRFQVSDAFPGFVYSTVGNRVGIGTETMSNTRLAVRGSMAQFGGTAADNYSPQVLSGLPMPTQANDVEVVGNYAYVVTSSDGDDFHIIDITDPANPVEVGSANLPATANAVAVRGRYAYVVLNDNMANEEFVVMDISDPINPVQIAAAELPTTGNDITIQGRYAYVVTLDVPDEDEFHVIDISDPLAPQRVTSISLADSANGITVAGNYAYVTTSVQGDDFHIIDISNPLAPVEVGSLNLPTTANAVAVRGSYAYAVTNATGDDFHVINITDPTAPVQVGSLNLPTAASDVTVAGRYAYVTTLASGDDVHVIDILDPTQPREIGSRDLAAGNATGITVVGRYAYVTSAATGNSFHVVDITGAELQSSIVHSLQSGNLSVSGSAVVAGRLQAGLGVRAGFEGVQTDGALSVLGAGDSFIAGHLGIGTSTPSSELTVVGTIRSTDIAGCAGITTDMEGNIVCDPSDENLKTEVVGIENALESVLQLQGVTFYWLDEERFGSQRELGFLAQEVAEVLPEAVRQHDEYWSLNPARLVAVVVEAIKEMWVVVRGNQSQIASLEARVKNLEQELANQNPASATNPTTPPPTSQPDTNQTPAPEASTGTTTSTTTASTTEVVSPPPAPPADTATTTTEDGGDTVATTTAEGQGEGDTAVVVETDTEIVPPPSSGTTTTESAVE